MSLLTKTTTKTTIPTMTMRNYEVRFCDQSPFYGWRFAYDSEKERYTMRYYEAHLQVNKDMMFAELGTPAGVPVLWSHNQMWTSSGQAIGRALTMEFEGGALLGSIGISEDDISAFVVGGLDVLEQGVNSGLSVGLRFLDTPPVKWKMQDGTAEKPDLMTFGRVRIIEVSVTPLPRLNTAGIIARLDIDDDETDDTEEVTEDA